MFKNTTHIAIILVVAVVAVANWVIAEEPTPGIQREKNRNTVRGLLEEGQKNGALPEGVFIRVHAHLYHAKEEKQAEAKKRGELLEEPFKEIWEFTATEVHRVVWEEGLNKKYSYRRIETRPFDSKQFSKELLEGKFLEIGIGNGKGEPTQYVGSDYRLGGRSIEFFRNANAESLLELYEHCTGPGYPESDAIAFGGLYEKLAAQGRKAFQPEKKKQ
jgi:hypothetical protein